MNKRAFGLGIILSLVLLFTLTCSANAANVALMNKLTAAIDSSELLSDTSKKFVKTKLFVLCTNPVFVDETKAQNSKNMTLDEIRRIDDLWQKAAQLLPIQREKLSNSCAVEIKKVAKELGLKETFVMDNMGGVVGENELTSDYWQGDEDKWQKAYINGLGGVDIAKQKLDRSTNTIDQKVSLPIIDDNGAVIGAICIGLNVDNI